MLHVKGICGSCYRWRIDTEYVLAAEHGVYTETGCAVVTGTDPMAAAQAREWRYTARICRCTTPHPGPSVGLPRSGHGVPGRGVPGGADARTQGRRAQEPHRPCPDCGPAPPDLTRCPACRPPPGTRQGSRPAVPSPVRSYLRGHGVVDRRCVGVAAFRAWGDVVGGRVRADGPAYSPREAFVLHCRQAPAPGRGEAMHESAASTGQREPPLSGDRDRRSLLLSGRYGLGADPCALSRGRRPLPGPPRRAAVHGDPDRRPLRIRRPRRPQCLWPSPLPPRCAGTCRPRPA